jgi:putative membrane protein
MIPARRIRIPLLLGAAYLSLFAVAAVRPHDRADWLLENALAAAFVSVLAATNRRFPLSKISYLLIVVFLCLHTIGAHDTYSLVPYDRWIASVTW